MTIDSKALVQAIKALPDYLQDKVYDKSQMKALGYAESTKVHFYSWWFPDYNRLLNARQDQTLHLFANNSCLFDYTKEKVGGISEGQYPTIKGHKIVAPRLIAVQAGTSYFEVRDGFELFEYFTEWNDPVAPRVWKIFNDLKKITVSGIDELCWRADRSYQ